MEPDERAVLLALVDQLWAELCRLSESSRQLMQDLEEHAEKLREAIAILGGTRPDNPPSDDSAYPIRGVT